MTIVMIILGAVALYAIFFVSQFYNIIFRGYAPFISTDRETIGSIINELPKKEQPVVYELGCGKSVFLEMVGEAMPRAELIGIENLATVHLFNLLKLKLHRSRIKLLRMDFFQKNLRDADFIYCYLNNDTMERLREKFEKECRTGTIVISRHFPIPQMQPAKTIDIKSKKIYFYSINSIATA